MTKQLFWLAALAACGGSSTPGADTTTTPATQTAPASEVPTVTAYVHGELAGGAQARDLHDQIAAGGEAPAAALGDRGHHVFLGTGDLGAPADEFLALDEWLTADGARSLYGDAKFQAGFSQLFTGPVVPELYQRHPDWVTWGDLAPPGDGPYWVMIVKGHLAKPTVAENRAAHDAVAGGFEQAARAAGDVAHVPHLAIDDDRVFFNVDVSTSYDGMLASLNNPEFQKAFGALFDAPPEVRIYRSTQWHQW
jgi:hypothetical protein